MTSPAGSPLSRTPPVNPDDATPEHNIDRRAKQFQKILRDKAFV
jgi:hypothetical protein